MLRNLRRDRLRSLDDAGAGPPTGLDGGESCYALRYRSALGRRDDFGGPSDRARAASMIGRSVSAPQPTCPAEAPTPPPSLWVARAGVLRSRAQRYFASQNANQRGSPRPMAIVVQMTCPFVDTETVQPRYLGWSTHNVGNCGRPIDQTYSAAGELTVHGQKQAGPR